MYKKYVWWEGGGRMLVGQVQERQACKGWGWDYRDGECIGRIIQVKVQ